MARVLICDRCGEPIDTNGILGDQSWVTAAVALDGPIQDAGPARDYHRACARGITLAEVWKREGLVAL